MPTARSLRDRVAMPALLAIALLSATPAASATTARVPGAATIAFSTGGYEGGPALAADGRVVIGAFRTLNVSGTGGIVTATVDVSRRKDGGPGAAIPRRLTSQTMTLLPTLATLGSCDPASSLQEYAAGGDGFVVSTGDDCAPNRSTIRLRTASGTMAIPVAARPGHRPDFAPDASDLRASGPVAAWVETRLPQAGPGPATEVVVVRGATGEPLLRAPLTGFAYGLGLGADATIAVLADSDCSLQLFSPAVPQGRRLPLPAGLCPQPSAFGVAGGRVTYAAPGGFAVTDAQGAAHWLAGTAGARSPLAFDGQTAFVVRADCEADRLLAVDAGVPGAAPPLPPRTLASCPVRRASASRLRVSLTGRVPIRLRCPAGCRGTLRLVEQRRGGRERLVTSTLYSGTGGTFEVRPRIARYARGRAGCGRGLRVEAVLFPASDEQFGVVRRKGLGAYRIHSRAACRRTSGPAFTKPRPGPRP